VEFKFKVVLEALKGLKRVSELASTYEVHSTLINRWKKELQEGGELFLVFPSARSMDGRGQALDNVFVERLWRSVNYEDVYIKDYGSVAELETGLTEYSTSITITDLIRV
jgi:hypothetical protein